MFEIVCKTETSDISNLVNTNHNSYQRVDRNHKIIERLGGYGNPLCSFIIDKGHPNGNEIHTITDNGIIIIQNENTKKFVTSLIARPGQIKRYFPNNVFPANILSVINEAKQHQRNGYNNW
jgi:hypothetical protein